MEEGQNTSIRPSMVCESQNVMVFISIKTRRTDHLSLVFKNIILVTYLIFNEYIEGISFPSIILTQSWTLSRVWMTTVL